MTICIPVFNESLTIVGYLRELETEFGNQNARVVIVDDCSTDETVLRIQEANFGEFVRILRNARNRGHGPSVVSGLLCAMHSDFEVVVTVDGDGDISATEIRKLLMKLENEGADLVEARRRERSDPAFRKLVSLGARCFITVLGGSAMWSAKDANTPVRAYKRNVLGEILTHLNADWMTPNLVISMLARNLELDIGYVDLDCRKVGGKSAQGMTWRARFKNVPSQRFLLFCYSATLEMLRIGLSLRRQKAHKFR